MFEQTPPNLPVSREPEDILEKVAPVGPPPTPTSPSASALPPKETVSLETPRQGMKRLMFILGIVVGVAIVGGGSWFLISKVLDKKPAATEEKSGMPVPEETVTPTTEAIVAPPPPAESVFPEPSPPPPAPLDTDGDGLSDADEQSLGTNVNLIDSDNDGLTDFEEINAYKTNPLNPDSDGDKYLDGQEVRSGYDPNGPGKLLSPPTP